MRQQQKSHAIRPFHTFLWKVSSRCNLNCSYCFVYNSADQLWKNQPAFMSEKVAIRAAERMLDHLKTAEKDDVSIIFHGGEPLLVGVKHLEMLTNVIEKQLTNQGIKVEIAIQTNLLLLNEEICKLIKKKNIKIGVSMDGPPRLNDIYRLDHAGNPTSDILEEKLALLTSPPYQDKFSGFLCVINLDSDPQEIIDYLSSWNPYSIDFLMPLNNHSNLPPGKEIDWRSTPYGLWLCRAFDYWLTLSNPPRIRKFESFIRSMMGMNSLVESYGLDPVDLIVIESNGEIEAVDSLKSTFSGATKLGYNIFDNSFDEVTQNRAIKTRQLGLSSLCSTCKNCEIVNVCGGGYIPHRYSQSNRFNNPSVYCDDVKLIVKHIFQRITNEVNVTN